MEKDNVENDYANQQCWTKYLTKVNKSCKIGQDQKTLISALSELLTAITKVLRESLGNAIQNLEIPDVFLFFQKNIESNEHHPILNHLLLISRKTFTVQDLQVI